MDSICLYIKNIFTPYPCININPVLFFLIPIINSCKFNDVHDGAGDTHQIHAYAV